MSCAVAVLAGIAAAVSHGAVAAGELGRDFAHPPEGTKPRCYWYWMDGHMSKEGATRDLEAMRRVGIGEAYVGLISGQSGIPAGDVKVLSEPFWDIMRHTVREAGRVGVGIGVFNSPGWSQSGGPWVKPGEAMRYLSTLQTRVRGPRRFAGKLPAPEGTFQDVSVLAFPTPAGDKETVAGRAHDVWEERREGDEGGRRQASPLRGLFDGDVKTACKVAGGRAVVVETTEPFTARSVVVHPAGAVNVACVLEVSEDGREFRRVREFAVDRHRLSTNVGPVPLAPVAVAFPAVSGRVFRLTFSGECTIGEVELSAAARVESYAEKQLIKVFQEPQPPFDFYLWPPAAEPERKDLVVDPKAVRDLTTKVGTDGTLEWDVPAGEWTILRAVALQTGVQNSPAAPEATGLEVDKMSRGALRAHFDAYVGEFLRRIPAGERKALKRVVADSYETGPQNFTDDLLEDFQRRYGYDARAFLPVLSGRVVGSADESDRFLWDLRRMVADRVSRDYVGGLRDLCREHGLTMWLENYGHWGFPGEFLQYGGQCDEIGGEFWATGTLGSVELRDASSAAHVYGMPAVFAEAWTGGPLFTSHPGSLKARGDWAYCQGVTQFVLHLYIHQPWDERRPGISAPFGTEFNRHNTWFGQAGAWVDYQRRCTVMLQHGKHVADVAYFIGEDAPKMTGQQKPALPPGYDFDFVNAEVIETRMEVRDGRFVLPDGMSYRVLVLPEQATMRPALLKKIRDLVAAGGAVLGEPPSRSPSRQDYARCDEQVRQVAGELWEGCDGKAVTSKAFGKGRVLRGVDLAGALGQLGVGPDLAEVDPATVLYVHRTAPGEQVYFLSNQSDRAVDVRPSFRVDGMAPELWHPDTGRVERPAVYEARDGRVRVPVRLGPAGSVFVVFREKASADAVVSVTGGEGSTLPADVTMERREDGGIDVVARRAGSYTVVRAGGEKVGFAVPGVPAPIELAGWEVTFPEDSGVRSPVRFERLASWAGHSDPRIRYFSGTAVYRTSFQMPADFSAADKAVYLDLGEVGVMADVKLNGKDLGTLWKPPYRVAVGRAARPGENVLEVSVVNVWHNRLVGQAKDPQALAGPPVVFQPSVLGPTGAHATSPLLPSGLIGPARVEILPVVRISRAGGAR